MRIYPDSIKPYKNEPMSSDVEVVNDNHIGKTLIANRLYESGKLMFEFRGQATTEITQWSLQVLEGLHIEDLHLVGYTPHSCNPNASVDMHKMTFTALREIKKGERITMDYKQTESKLYSIFECNCGSPVCKVIID